MTFEKPLRMTKTEQFEVKGPNLTEWLGAEVLTSASAESSGGQVSIITTSHDSDSISFIATGVSRGSARVVVDYSTATRSDSVVVNIIVIGETESAQNLIPSTLRARI
jgi:hypothetical protein